ncbi:MAG TPA: ATP-binding protein [Anaerolineaceae bacterium]
MDIISPLQPPFYLAPPAGWIAWFGWAVLLVAVLWGGWRLYESGWKWGRRDWMLLVGLLVGAVVFCALFGVRLPALSTLPPPNKNEDPRGPALMIFIAVPWMLAGGLFGPLPAAVLGLISGLIVGYADSHSLFTALEYAGLALLFTAMVRQRYRTLIFRVLRHPLGAAAVLCLAYFPVFLIDVVVATPGSSVVVRTDYAISLLQTMALASGAELLIGGLIVEAASCYLGRRWGRHEALRPSPTETSLQTRFFYGIGPLVVLLLVTLMVGDWVVAGTAARTMLSDRLSSTAHIAAETIPFFLETGQNLILQQASDASLAATPTNQLAEKLHDKITAVPFFRQLYLMDKDGKPIGGFPESDFTRSPINPEEEIGIQLALKGISMQVYTIPPIKGESTAQVSFIAAVKDASGGVQGVLVGRSDLATNPFTKPIIQTFEDMSKLGEAGIILDENGRILYHPEPSWVMKQYSGRIPTSAEFFDDTATDGTRSLVYFQPAVGRSWSVVLSVPAQRSQQIALDIAIPMMVIILIIGVLAYISLRLGLRVVTVNLKTLAGEAGRIAQGELDNPLVVTGEDEVGQLRQAFDRMRISLKTRLDELNRLLLVSQGVASSLEIQDAVRPILESALSVGASCARVVLAIQDEDAQENNFPESYGLGPASEIYAYLDEQILGLTRNHQRLVLTNLSRGRGLNFPFGLSRPGAVLAFALRHEAEFYGTLWIAFDQPAVFNDEEIRFLATLAGQAALAAVNTKLYDSAEIGRERLEAILAATPDPVLVTDQQNRILLFNPAAQQLPGLEIGPITGRSIEAVVAQKELVELLQSSGEDQPSREIYFPNGRVYYATVASVVADGQSVGKVCTLRNITHFKEVDSLKSDFVATVSHDLRSPLTLMRGYATMLQMVGELNEQQKGYVRKIINGVESMSRLVNSVLDLGRIEAGVGLQIEVAPASDVVERVIGSLQLTATQKKIKLNADLPESDNTMIEADQALLQQALYNLVENGIKYTPVGGEVTLQVQSRPGTVVFAVRDSGIGIAPLDQPKLFDKFYKAGVRETVSAHGSGLGLAIVKSIVDRHRGRVWLESNLGKGSCFYIEIPVKQKIAGESPRGRG